MKLRTRIFLIAGLCSGIIFGSAKAAANITEPASKVVVQSTTRLTAPTPTTESSSTTSTTIHQRAPKKLLPRSNVATTFPQHSDYQYLGPCIVAWESGGGIIGNKDYLAENPYSTASGQAQWLDSTWNNWGGYARAKDAPPSVQDERLAYDLSLGLRHIRQSWAAQRGHCSF